MKLNTAFSILLAVICTASHARARSASYLRDPRTVEEKEEVQRQTMGDGYSQMGREVHIPGCVDMTPDQCMELAMEIIKENPNWFKDGLSTSLNLEVIEIDTPSEMAYYKLGLPVSSVDTAPKGSKVITGVARNCMVHYPWDWCVSSSGDTACLKLQPWDCSGVGGECLNTNECCAKIQVEYPKPDINGNELQCYEWVLPGRSNESGGGNTSTGGSSSGSGTVKGNRLVIHVREGKVALPAVITDRNHELVHDEDIIEVKEEKAFVKSFLPTNENGYSSTLQFAVSNYVSQNCATTNHDCEIGKEWGYPINSWRVEKVTNFYKLFYYMRTFNDDINGWTTSQVTNMHQMFNMAQAFNQPLDNWDVSSVTDMFGVFYQATSFNQPLDSWDVSSVTTMYVMFMKAVAFNQPLNNWDTSSVTNMAHMFSVAEAFNQPLNNWNVSRVTDMNSMFKSTDMDSDKGASAFNQPLDSWDVSSVTNMHRMFFKAIAFNQPLNNWDVSKVANMYYMYYGASAFNQNLCHFGDYFDSGYYKGMFYETTCTDTGNPTSVQGPWCSGYC